MLLPNAIDQTITVSGIGVHLANAGNGRFSVTVTEPKPDGTHELWSLPVFDNEQTALQAYRSLIAEFRQC